MSTPYAIINAFTDSKTGGNPAAVVLFSNAQDARANDTAWMQQVAHKFDLSETAFLVPLDSSSLVGDQDDSSGEARYGLRWFTPSVEVDLCGHATLASAHFLFRHLHQDVLRFETRSGQLVVRRNKDSTTGSMSMDFPADKHVLSSLTTPTKDEAEVAKTIETICSAVLSPPNVRELLRFPKDAEGKPLLPIGKVGLVVPVAPSPPLESYKVDAKQFARIEWAELVTFTQARNDKVDVASRVFAPNCGIDEDPVTGAAHCLLAPFWLGHAEARKELERVAGDEFEAEQVSERRGRLHVAWNRQTNRVTLVGQAVLVESGNL